MTLALRRLSLISLLPCWLFCACVSPSQPASQADPLPQPITESIAPEQLTQADLAFEEELAKRTFDYFWETTNPETCLSPDRWPSPPFASIAAVGFELTALGVGVERGFVTREQAADRARTCLSTYYEAPQNSSPRAAGYRGFYYHFLDMETGLRYQQTELSSVDSSLFFLGVLFAQSYFDLDTETERDIRRLADLIYRRADWSMFVRGPDDPPATNHVGKKAIAMGWKPETGFEPHDWIGYDEGLLVYVLAAGSPTYPLSKEYWDKGWASGLEESWGTFYGEEHLGFPPMFGHQFSHIWIDLRGIQDAFMRSKGIDYFINSQRAVIAQFRYAEDNPMEWKGYGDGIWGLSAGDGPGYTKNYRYKGEIREFQGYFARGAGTRYIFDDGTLTPNASGGSIPFMPKLSIRSLRAIKRRYPDVYARYGFKDSFNPSFTFTDFDSYRGSISAKTGWVSDDYLGIGQGAILAMLENDRSELIWATMKKSPYIIKGLTEVGFCGGWLEAEGAPCPAHADQP